MKKRDSSGIILVSMMVIGLLFITGCSGEGADPVVDDSSGTASDGGNTVTADSPDARPLTDNPVDTNEVPIAEGCDCPETIDYVCGTDNHKYFNACEAECQGVEYELGECNTRVDLLQLFPCEETTGGLSGAYNPVCGYVVLEEEF